jgi:N-acetylglucosamine kinase-like BadF-type ATPase
MYAGISGGGVGENASILHDFFSTLGFYRFDNGNDALTIISAGLDKGNGVAIIMGTGTVAYVQKDGELTKLSGLGYLFDNGGNGYCFGRDALRAAMIAEYDADSYTAMLPLVREKLNTDSVTKKIPEIYALGKRGIASFARIPFTAARAGDKIALDLLDKNMKEIADILNVAGKLLPDEERIRTVFVGSLTKEDDLLFPLIRKYLCNPERFDFVIMRDAPILGAIKLASQLD